MEREVNLRAPVYNVNLDKERDELRRFIYFIKFYNFFDYPRYKINPTNSLKNIMGSDITLYDFEGNTTEIDLKGFNSNYKTVALTVKRSDDNVVWRDALSNKKITDEFVFIDELGNMYGLMMDKAREFCKNNTYKVVDVPAETAGHYQKAMIIPLKDLEPLASLVPPYTGRII